MELPAFSSRGNRVCWPPVSLQAGSENILARARAAEACYHLRVFFSRKPSSQSIKLLLDQQRDQPFSYAEVGATRVADPTGYHVDRNRIRLGEGREIFAKAVAALKHWRMFEMDWVQIVPDDAPVAIGSVIGVLVQHLGFWSLNFTRIVYLIEDKGPQENFGFAYGTLSDHAERGEERFTVEYHSADNSVWYDLLAFSRPRHLLARLGYPISRRLQKRFAGESLRAMHKAANE
jgi:uncharacterized protein (UPF0548 family)